MTDGKERIKAGKKGKLRSRKLKSQGKIKPREGRKEARG